MVKSAYLFIINEKAASQSGTYVGSFTEDSVRRREAQKEHKEIIFPISSWKFPEEFSP